ncbi:HD-GYP domain-containing protein [Endothiovibrio diazotrophicus]
MMQNNRPTMTHAELIDRLDKLTSIGLALSKEKDSAQLLEKILLEAKALTSADGGTLYTVTDEDTLEFQIVRTDSLGIAMGGSTGQPINFPQIPLHDADGNPNEHAVVAHAVLHDDTINIPDAYEAEGFDFSGTRAFDQRTGYRSKSFLTVPLKNHQDDIIGVLQLLNKIDGDSGEVVAFSIEDQTLAESLASQAAVALTNKRLIEDLKTLFEAFIQIIASAIDEKSPYTGAHCRRVPVLTLMLADAARDAADGPWADFQMTDEQRYELEIAAWLHDCGKVVTPVNVVDKSTKLEAIHDRVHEVSARFEVLRRDAEIELLKGRLQALEEGRPEAIPALEEHYRETLALLDEENAFVHKSNVGGEFMSDDDCERVREIGRRSWRHNGRTVALLSENEIYNLTIPKGTLTPEEREIINNHVVVTLKMLESLPFPKHLKNVPEFAGGHHERMDGKGYPRGLTREQMSPQARMMAIADIFEALTASDRPYKPRKTISESLRIMGFMKKEGHIDPDLFDLFIRAGIYRDYADQYLEPEQSDAVDLAKIPGYEP